MKKQELIAAIAAKAKLSQRVVLDVLNAQTAVVHQQMKGGSDVVLHGIGKLEVKMRDARPGRNPATGETIQLPAKRLPKFTAHQHLKDAAA